MNPYGRGPVHIRIKKKTEVAANEIKENKMFLSSELFPPTTDKGMENLPGTIDHLCKCNSSCIF